jgi:hypothetical protein
MGEAQTEHDKTETSEPCPECGKFKENKNAENGEFTPLMRHMTASKNHPSQTAAEARKRLKTGEAPERDGGGDADSPEGSADNEHTREGPGESVLTATPPVMADGGNRECPECESEMDSVNGSFAVVGQVDGETEKMVTEGDESYCPDCDIVTDGNTVMESARVDD